MVTRFIWMFLGALAGLSLMAPLSADEGRPEGPAPLSALDHALARAAEQAQGSIVLIHAERDASAERPVTTAQARRLGLLGQSAAQGYFDRPAAPGVGVVIDPAGTIVTASFHVAGKLKNLFVVGPDGKRRKAKVLGTDPNLDISAVTVEDTTGLKALPLGTSQNIVPGRLTLLVSRSEGSDGVSATFGIISAVDRLKKSALQISSRMNYGNVGGALLDVDGRLIGIAAHLSNRSPTGQNSGVGFAAPIDLIQKSLPTLLAGRDVPRIANPFLGIQGSQAQTENQKGVKIQRVLENTAAAQAKLQANDTIMIFNGVEVNDFLTLSEEILRLSVGDKIIVTVTRDGWEKDFTIVLGTRPPDQED